MEVVLNLFMVTLFPFIELFSDLADYTSILAVEGAKDTLFGIDMSIEGLRSYKFSVAIFVFLIISLILFSVIIYLYWPKNETKIRTGEKIMFGAIIFGMFIAVVIGWIQLIEGYLI